MPTATSNSSTSTSMSPSFSSSSSPSDTKKKELVGNFKNHGAELRPKGDPEPVRVHDFVIPELGRAPYGVYDLANNSGWVSVGVDHDTSAFETIRRWWYRMGQQSYPQARASHHRRPVAAMDRERLWKVELQRLADETGLELRVPAAGHQQME